MVKAAITRAAPVAVSTVKVPLKALCAGPAMARAAAVAAPSRARAAAARAIHWRHRGRNDPPSSI
ncbi:hypothetical protein GCM10022241_18710 [Micrococcus endophyticus]